MLLEELTRRPTLTPYPQSVPGNPYRMMGDP